MSKSVAELNKEIAGLEDSRDELISYKKKLQEIAIPNHHVIDNLTDLEIFQKENQVMNQRYPSGKKYDNYHNNEVSMIGEQAKDVKSKISTAIDEINQMISDKNDQLEIVYKALKIAKNAE